VAVEGSAVIAPRRLVLDTNVWLDWLVFRDPGIAPLQAAVAAGAAHLYTNPAATDELARVLGYPLRPKLLTAEEQSASLAELRRIARKVDEHTPAHAACPLPVCGDPDDQKFLELSLACAADFLVTRDRDLLELARHKVRPLPFRIVTLREMAACLKADSR
jgi:uncharacterized protein